MMSIEYIKEFIYGAYRLFNAIIMFIPIKHVRWIWCKLTLRKVGKNIYFSRNIAFNNPRNIILGDNIVINRKCLLDGRGSIICIGDSVDIAMGCSLWTMQHDVNDPHHSTVSKKIIIGNYVWIASNVTVLPGISIGDNSVVGTCSVVTRDVAADTIVAGNPARFIKKRTNKKHFLDKRYVAFFE